MSTPRPTPLGLPRIILVGLILVGLGVLFTGISYGWDLIGIRLIGLTGFVLRLQIEIALILAEYLCTQLGLFLIFLGVLRLLPRVLPWSRLGPILILSGALLVLAFDLAELVLVSLSYSSSGFQLPEWVSYLISGALIAGYVAATLGLLLSLFAVAKGLLLRTFTTAGAPQV